MNRSLALLAALCLLIGPLATADAAVWHREPGDVGLVWLGPGLDNTKAQRDVYLDFDVDHEASPGPIPGAFYSGTHDSAPVWNEDSVDWTNINRIMNADPYSPTGTKQATRTTVGSDASITIDLGNLGGANATKEIWIEWVSTSSKDYAAGYDSVNNTPLYYPLVTATNAAMVSYESAAPAKLSELYTTFAAAEAWFNQDYNNDGVIDEFDWNAVKDRWYVHNVLVRLSPCPDLETITFNVPKDNAGNTYYMDTIHIATNAIPEPGTLLIWSALTGLAVGLVGWRPGKS